MTQDAEDSGKRLTEKGFVVDGNEYHFDIKHEELKFNETYEATLDLQKISSLKAWGMNQNIIYTICIKPTATDPNNPHTEDPEDVVITFDPALNSWENIQDAIIQI